MVALSNQLFLLKNEGLHYLRPTRRKLFPELEEARSQRQRLLYVPQSQHVFQRVRSLLEDRGSIPQTSYTAYRLFRRTGERASYQKPSFLKRAQLSAGAISLFLGETDRKNMVQDYLWNICEESNWVAPAHETRLIDLSSSETGLLLAETLLLLEETLDEEVRHRVRMEIERRIFEPYLRFHQLHDWYQRGSNWNGVCNSAIAATFLILEEEPVRLKKALEIALTSLDVFLDAAFEDDGSSTEGVSYWQYGLINFVVLAEFLYALSDGAINLLATEKMKRIATFPLNLQISGSNFASFADCDETVKFHPGFIARLAKRTDTPELLNLLAGSVELENDWRLPMRLRDIFWWDGTRHATSQLKDTLLPISGTARLVSHITPDMPLILSIKAGHNDAQHNHNDIGSFLLHVAGENVLTDPGPGLYSRDYFDDKRYDNIFANSYGHSVPRIDGMLQGTGRSFAGELIEVPAQHKPEGLKHVALEFAAAYPCSDLTSARREMSLSTDGTGMLWLHDRFMFAEEEHEVEEAFITWLDCEVDGATARIFSSQSETFLILEQQPGVVFQLEYLEEQSKANQKPKILKRLSVTLPPGKIVDVMVRIKVVKR